jgi:L-ascorbate 6-phosphate lactonase
MQITWLGQAGFLFEKEGFAFMVDPYLSDSLNESVGEIFKRLIPVKEKFLEVDPDLLIFTHAHGDHADEKTIKKLLSSSKKIDVLCPQGVYEKLKPQYVYQHNLVLFDRGNEWTKNGITFRAIKAAHSDISAVGVIFKMEGQSIYITGDTLYNREIFTDLDEPIDLLFVAINGAGNNMNIDDALRFTKRIAPKAAIPMHWGMFPTFSIHPDPFIEGLKGSNIKTLKMRPFEVIKFRELF